MLVREFAEERERQTLSSFAQLSCNTRGREREEKKCSIRTEYQRDRDRILYSKAFRRLKHKTQVFISPEGDHYRTRLTHTLEVSQIARTIARALRLNEDLTEAIALGHDLGHTPYGHAGERVLERVCPLGFKHNEQSVRVVEVLEKNGQGLNLTWEVRDGIRCHKGDLKAATLEGRIINIADRIAYINHDIEDAIRGGILSEKSLPIECTKVLGKSSSERINNMIIDIIENSRDRDDIVMSDEFREATNELRDFMFNNVYVGSQAKKEEVKAERLVERIYLQMVETPYLLPERNCMLIEKEGIHRVVCDYVAGMTDRYAQKIFYKIYIPDSWSSI